MTNTLHTTRRLGDESGTPDHERLSLVALVRRIVDFSDFDALCELHEHRTIFRHNGRHSLVLVQYVDELRNDAIERGDGTIADQARDLTVDKFLRLASADDCGDDMKSLGHSKTDCRNYYRSFLNEWEARENGGVFGGGIQRELRAAKLLQGLVTRHFRFSLRESLRHKSGLRTRYAWVLPGGRISLMIPGTLSGRGRSAWLEQNVEDPDPARPGERERIQKIIDDRLGYPQSCDFDDAVSYRARDADHLGMLPQITPEGLAVAVATEKADNIDLQRPRVRALGEEALKDMILEIFVDLANGDYYDGRIARKYGLAKATFSRFAGSRWNRETGPGCSIPDLWANTARVVAADENFIAAARGSGVWQSVQRALESENTTGRASQ